MSKLNVSLDRARCRWIALRIAVHAVNQEVGGRSGVAAAILEEQGVDLNTYDWAMLDEELRLIVNQLAVQREKSDHRLYKRTSKL